MTLRERILKAAAVWNERRADLASALPPKLGGSRDYNFIEGARWEHKQLLPLITSLADCAEALIDVDEMLNMQTDGEEPMSDTHHAVKTALAALERELGGV